MLHQQKVESILREVEKPGRYIGGEWNEKKKDPSRAEAKIALIFPDVYEIGMSYLGQKILYAVLNNNPAFLAERVFAPWPDLEAKLRAQDLPLFSLENKIPLRDFDILGISLLYELNYSNILTILDLGGIPLLGEERAEEHPLVIAGGPAAFNPEPVSDIFDAFLIGDGEEAFPEIAETYRSMRKSGARKADILNELAKHRGVYVPRLYEAFQPEGQWHLARRPLGEAPAIISKRVLASLEKAPFPEDIVVPDVRVVFDRVAIEVARGCPQRCRFCQAAAIYFPSRVLNPSSVLSKVWRSLRRTGYEDVSLSALSISDYPLLEQMVAALMEGLAQERISLSLSSLRPKGLSSGLAESILRVRKTGFTLVPEAGTDRLRRVINKNLGDQDILEASENAFRRGWRLLKLYFMIGLPTEREEDLEGIVELAKEITRMGQTILKSPPQLNLSISSFIPKPHTPFQWLAMEEEGSLKEKQHFLRSRLCRLRSVKIKAHPVLGSVLEGVFSRGDRRLGPVLAEAWRKGARFDGWKDAFDFSLWEKAFLLENVASRRYLGALDVEARLPWEHIDTGLKKSYLLHEFLKAGRVERTPSCLETNCAACQGCDIRPRQRKRLPPPLRRSSPTSRCFGQKTEKVLRYAVFYSKTGRARFLSHLDLANHLQRTLRRAGMEVSFSAGFHPKMLLSYGPALPLGIEGKAEYFEFKSPRLFHETKGITRLNKFAGSGIQFLQMRKLGEAELPLNARLEAMVYSVDLANEEVKEASAAKMKTVHAAGMDLFDFVEREMAGFLEQNPHLRFNFEVDRKEQELFLHLPYSSRGGPRAQDIVKEIFRLPYPSFVLRREKFIFQKIDFFSASSI